jgi:hypothetical protein
LLCTVRRWLLGVLPDDREPVIGRGAEPSSRGPEAGSLSYGEAGLLPGLFGSGLLFTAVEPEVSRWASTTGFSGLGRES